MHHLNEKRTGRKNPMAFGSNRMRMYESLEEGDFEYMGSMPFYIKIVRHAGMTNDLDLEAAKRKKLESVVYIRHVSREGKWVSAQQPSVDTIHWSEVYDGNQGVVVYGHDDFDEVKVDAHAIGIDTGCVYGNKLTAIVFEDTIDPLHGYTLEHVPAKRVYFEKND